jgi:hypothetical protein
MAGRITKSLLLTLAAVLLFLPGAADAATIKTHSNEQFGELDTALHVDGRIYHWSHLNYHLRTCSVGRPGVDSTCSWTLIGIESENAGCAQEYSAGRGSIYERKFFHVGSHQTLSLTARPGAMVAYPGAQGADELCWYVQFDRAVTDPLVATTTIKP